ncbi:MAG: tyrosine-type recombinase/integrase, partial [Promethearchaeota archaeon]
EEFLITKQVEEGRSTNTIKAYQNDLKIFFKFLIEYFNQKNIKFHSLESIKTIHLKLFLQSLANRNYSKVGIARKIATLKSFFNYAYFLGYIKKNPTVQVRSPRISRMENLPKFLSSEEISAILQHVKEKKWIQEYIMLRFMYATMCRVSELCGVKIKDIDLPRLTVRLRGKGNKERLVPLDEKTARLVKQHIFPRRSSPDDNLFWNRRGAPIKPRMVQIFFQKIKKELKFPDDKKLTPHVFRHTGATMLRRNGMDISELQDLLGHASPNTTRIYAKNDIEVLSASYRKMHPLSK